MKKYLIGGVVLIAVVVLMSWGKIFSGSAEVTFWPGTQVACLPNGHQNLALHIHQDLQITVDGVSEEIPANIGVDANCMAETHTHDTTGKLHEEATVVGKMFTLGEFFSVWGKPIEREGYTLTATVNGVANADPALFPLKDGMEIVLAYTASASTTAAIAP